MTDSTRIAGNRLSQVKKNIYLLLAILGFLAPYYFFLQLPGEDGFDLAQLIQPMFANNLLRGVAMDLMVSVIVFWVYLFAEANKLQMKNPWLYLLATLLVGLSFALPLFLYFRERQLEQQISPLVSTERLNHQ